MANEAEDEARTVKVELGLGSEQVQAEEAPVEALSPALPPITQERRGARQARLDARQRVLAAREDLERRVAEATAARLKRQAEAEETARRRAEEAQRRAKRRLALKKKADEEKGSPSASAPESARSPSPGRSHSPGRCHSPSRVSEELPGMKSAKVRVKKKVLKQREEQEARLREIEEDRARVELRKRQDEEAAEVHRIQAAKRAAERWRREKEAEARAKAEKDQEVLQARQRKKLYRNPKEIARLIADAQELHTAEERRRAQQQEEAFLQRERERARRHVDGEIEDGRPFGAPNPSKTPWDDENFLAKTVHALTDEEWKVNINFT